jgi:hypothetical protein
MTMTILVNIHCNCRVSAATPSVGDLLYDLKLLSNFYNFLTDYE